MMWSEPVEVVVVLRMSSEAVGSACILSTPTSANHTARHVPIDSFAVDAETLRKWVHSVGRARKVSGQVVFRMRHVRASTMERVLDEVAESSDELQQMLRSSRWQAHAAKIRPSEAALYLGLQQAVHHLLLLGRRVAPSLPTAVWALIVNRVLTHNGHATLRRWGYLPNGVLKIELHALPSVPKDGTADALRQTLARVDTSTSAFLDGVAPFAEGSKNSWADVAAVLGEELLAADTDTPQAAGGSAPQFAGAVLPAGSATLVISNAAKAPGQPHCNGNVSAVCTANASGVCLRLTAASFTQPQPDRATLPPAHPVR